MEFYILAIVYWEIYVTLYEYGALFLHNGFLQYLSNPLYIFTPYSFIFLSLT